MVGYDLSEDYVFINSCMFGIVCFFLFFISVSFHND